MKKTLALAFIAFSCALTAVEITCEAPKDGFVRLGLRSELMSVEIVPQVSALLGSWRHRPENRELIGNLVCSRNETELLPTMFETNGIGGRELIWKKRHFHNVPFQLLEATSAPDSARLVLFNRYLMNENVEARKEITLREGELKLSVIFTLTNRAKTTQQMSLWTNLIAHLGPDNDYDTVVLPAKGGLKTTPVHRVMRLSSDQLYIDEDLGIREVFVAPAAHWLARYSRKRPGVLVIRTEPALLTDGVFYSYKRGPLSTTHTMEIVFPNRDFATNVPVAFPIDHLYFPHLTGISALCGDLALHWEGTQMHCESAVPQDATTMVITYLDKEGRELNQATLQLPAMQTGKMLTLKLAPPQGAVVIKGTLGKGSPFTILPTE